MARTEWPIPRTKASHVRSGMRRAAVAISASAMLAAATAGPVAAAGASPQQRDKPTSTSAASQKLLRTVLACAGSASVDFTPGINLIPRNFTATTDNVAGGCLDLSLSPGPRVQSAKAVASLEAVGGCAATVSAGSASVQWTLSDNSTDTSTIALNPVVVVPVVGINIVLGTVTSGRFTGATLSITPTSVDIVNTAGPCLTEEGAKKMNVTGLAVLAMP